MPELPEVETIRRGLEDKIVGRKITAIDVLWGKSFIGKKEDVISSKVVDIVRRAKVIQIKLSNGLNLLFHLKLTGQMIHESKVIKSIASVSMRGISVSGNIKSIKSAEEIIDFAGGHPSHDWSVSARPSLDGHAEMPNSNTRIIFSFDDGSKLFFNDMRKFGWCKVLTSAEIEAIYKKDYGLEPIDEMFTVDYLLTKAKNITNRTVKQFLLDQTIAAGMGNIYTDEALFEARIMPTRKVKDIKMVEWKKIIEGTQKVLALGIKYGGTTDSDYVNVDGKKGGMQDYLKVYHRVGEACADNCGGKVERMVVGGRGTHFCPSCQK